MQNDTSQFVVNIIPLQNVQTTVSGLDATSILSNDVDLLKKMVNTNTKRIFTDSLASYTTGGTIQVISPMNLCNVSVTGTSLSNVNSVLTMNATSDPSGIAVNIGTTSLPSAITVSEVGNLNVTGSGTFGGICYATQFVTLSDMMAKTDMRKWRSTVLIDLHKIHPYIFSYKDSVSQDIGLMAQEVGAVWPQLVKEGVKGVYVNYDGVVAMLLKAVQELGARVSTLEG
jgi:hypothetical protein